MDNLLNSKNYDELYKTYNTIIEMQLSLSMDSVRAKKAWLSVLSDVDVSVLSDVLANVLNHAGYKLLTRK
ncbi:hypothetical protein NOM68_13270 [Proteus mirabilis]|uniref:hypothetical protein n=1 Tax=Proteus mirabilis TaxID=584 RepID=UPI00217E043D|nr:hypothetical protein [Proteus mirabilis]MCS6722539.1 hypothetical protein [Proteus mirabilis]MCS6730015.1 hypothetical protein [Proteus mirabilis]MCS6736702.1 hypothetical protein [Proteus mirabilis]MCS6750213.1 hypothetical protein [Proteus mirabilis]